MRLKSLADGLAKKIVEWQKVFLIYFSGYFAKVTFLRLIIYKNALDSRAGHVPSRIV